MNVDFKDMITRVERVVDCDVEQRILRAAIVATTGLASDGWIILPDGMILDRYRETPIITARHLIQPKGAADPQPSLDAVVVANAINIEPSSLELMCDIQFADTELGRDYAYLYGINREKKPYMRAWSLEGPILERTQVSWDNARRIAGQYWDDNLASRLRARVKAVMVATKLELSNVAAVPLGADRHALTQAVADGVRSAGEILTRIDLDLAESEVDALKRRLLETDERVAKIEEDIQALRSEGALAAERRDSGALLDEIRALRETMEH